MRQKQDVNKAWRGQHGKMHRVAPSVRASNAESDPFFHRRIRMTEKVDHRLGTADCRSPFVNSGNDSFGAGMDARHCTDNTAKKRLAVDCTDNAAELPRFFCSGRTS